MIDIPAGLLYRALGTARDALNQKAITSSNEELSQLVREAMCDFQLHYTNYQFNASRLHKSLKESWGRGDQSAHIHYSQLTELAESGMAHHCGLQARLIRKYFNLTHRHLSEPRVGIHLCDDEDTIINLVMLPSNGQNDTEKKIEDYTVFTRVLTTGLPYLNNNLPKDIIDTIKSGEAFKHKGIDVDSIKKNYLPKFGDKKIPARFRNNFIKKLKKDSDWSNFCAVSGDTTNGVSSMYKSHLVIPITFRAHMDENQLDPTLIKILSLREGGRSILGFVCVDHPATHYFDDREEVSYENIDINILYMFADMLSLTMITKLMYTSGSTTYVNYTLNN